MIKMTGSSMDVTVFLDACILLMVLGLCIAKYFVMSHSSLNNVFPVVHSF